MSSINSVTLVGRVVRDLEVKTTQSGKSVASFALAVDGYGKDAPANFIDMVAWGKAAEILAEYAGKGKQIAVTGRIQTRPWETKDGDKRKATEIVVDQFQLLGGKGDGSSAAPATERYDEDDAKAKKPKAKSKSKSADTLPDDFEGSEPIDLSEIPF